MFSVFELRSIWFSYILLQDAQIPCFLFISLFTETWRSNSSDSCQNVCLCSLLFSASNLIPHCFIELLMDLPYSLVIKIYSLLFLSCWAPGSWSLYPPAAGPRDVHLWDQIYRQRPWRQILFQCDRWSRAQWHCGCPGWSHLHSGRSVDEWKM